MKGGKSFKMKGGCIDSNTVIIVVGLLALLALAYYFMTMNNNNHKPTMGPTMGPTMPGMMKKVEGFSSGSDLTPKDGQVVVALFAADWCPHCQDYKPKWEQIQSQASSNKKIRFETVDCTKENPYPGEYGIKGYPTVVAISSKGSQHIDEKENLKQILSVVEKM